jgi:mannonate dehydratase
VSIDEQLAAEYSYTPAYLPVSRLADGTVHDW